MQKLRILPPAYLVVFITSSILLAVLLVSTARYILHPGILPGFADKDFANYWVGARLLLGGHVLELFGPQPQYFRHLTDAFGPLFPWHNWSYPPHYLLFIWPLGFLGYKAAMMLFLAVTGTFFLWMIFQFAGRGNVMALVAAGPFLTHNLWVAQNGYMFAGLALGVLAFREKRPVIAGILLGILTIKPQLGILFPFLLLAERRWTVIAVASGTTAALVALSAAVFGLSTWQGYLTEVIPYQTFVMRELEGTFLAMLASVYGMLRDWNVGPDLAMTAHGLFAAVAFLLCLRAFFTVGDGRARAVILLVGTFLVTPYALTYDLGMLAGALAVIPQLGTDRKPEDQKVQVLLALAMFLPVIMMTLGQLKVPIAPAVLTMVLVVVLRRVDFRLPYIARLVRRGPETETTIRPSSPAASSG